MNIFLQRLKNYEKVLKKYNYTFIIVMIIMIIMIILYIYKIMTDRRKSNAYF